MTSTKLTPFLHEEQDKGVVLTFDCSTIKYDENIEKYTITFRDAEMTMHKVIMNAKYVQTNYDFSIPEPDRSAKFTTIISDFEQVGNVMPEPYKKKPKPKPKPKTEYKEPPGSQSVVYAVPGTGTGAGAGAGENSEVPINAKVLLKVMKEKLPKEYYQQTIMPMEANFLGKVANDMNFTEIKKKEFNKTMRSYFQGMKVGWCTKIHTEFKKRMVTIVYWLWMGEHGLGPYDPQTQLQIEKEFQTLLKRKKSGQNNFPLSEGPWFGLQRNKGKYVIDIELDCTTGRSIIKRGRQRNVTTKYTRPIERIPRMLSLDEQQQYNNAPAFWMWKDSDHHLWQNYGWESNAQLEHAYVQKENSVQLTHGWFGQKSGYYVKFSYESVPVAGQQVNKGSGFSRRVRRVSKQYLMKAASKSMAGARSGNAGGKGFTADIKDWQKKFRPLTNIEFQRILLAAHSSIEKDGVKCSICQELFEEQELLQNQKPDQFGGGNNNNNNNNGGGGDGDPAAQLERDWENLIQAKCLEFFKAEISNFDTIAHELTLQKFGKIKKTVFNKMIKKVTKAKAGPLSKVYSALKAEHGEMSAKMSAIVHTHDDALLGAVDEILDRTIVSLMKCKPGHYFHATCISKALLAKRQCPNCQEIYGVVTGPQPSGFFCAFPNKKKCDRHPKHGTIQMIFEFPDGVQTSDHQNPGRGYMGDFRLAFVPNSDEGREAMCLIRIAFNRGLLFTVGTSLTSKKDNQIIFQSIHLKTRWDGGKQCHGYPDADYFDRLKEELLPKGITADLLTNEERHFIGREWVM